MPTSVSTARQCLTEEAASALDDAVAVARRRSHAQTTSLHAVSALLSLPSSILRDACARARSASYPPRLQFRALELCVGVSLDRLPSSRAPEEPPVSNSLAAAIKRSQANQRRQPETFHLYQQMQQNGSSSISSVKVELKHFILSILDDPIVSRVLGDAGFRSRDIKLAIAQPPRFSRARCPPLFLCNLSDASPGSGRPGFRFPFAGFSGQEGSDESCRRIGEVLVKKDAKNPLLIGVCASDTLNNFTDFVSKCKSGVLPSEIDGASVFCIGKEISEFVGDSVSEEMLGLRFKELSDELDGCKGAGIVVSYGDLEVIVEGGRVDAVDYVVARLRGLVEVHGERLWLIGAVGNYEIYRKFLGRFPSIEKDWDIQLLPITSSKSSVGELQSKSSLMGSFVPFGGFFPTTSEFGNMLSSTNQSSTRCDLCNKRYEQEVSAIRKGGSTKSVADQHSAGLPSWLQMAECVSNKITDAVEARDDGTVSSAKLMGLQRKWNDICQQLHQNPSLQGDISQVRSQAPGVESFQLDADGKEVGGKASALNETRCITLSSRMPLAFQKVSLPRQDVPITSGAENANFRHEVPVKVSNQQLEVKIPWRPSDSPQSFELPPERTSPSSHTPVTTDLGLGTLYASCNQEPTKFISQDHNVRLLNVSGSVTSEVDTVNKSAPSGIVRSSSCSLLGLGGQVDEKDFKHLFTALCDKVGWQADAILTISQTISHCRSAQVRRHGSNHEGNIWLSFSGPDKVGKKRIALGLAELFFGCRERFISVDLSSEEHGIKHSDSIFDSQHFMNYDGKFRGQTVVDYIAEEVRRKPHSVVFIDNIDKADILAKNSLLQAVRTGKFPDSHGREITINNMIFLTTSSKENINENFLAPPEFSEERILRAKSLQMQIVVGKVSKDVTKTGGSNMLLMPCSVNKRKLSDCSDSTEQEKSLEILKRAHKVSNSFLDLNLPVEDAEESDAYGSCESDSGSENSEVWLEEFLDQVDEKVVFKPFDFDSLADKFYKMIGQSFQKIVGFDTRLEIDPDVMVQILAAAWLSERKRAVEEWIEQVLCRSFVEAQEKHRLTGQSVVKLVALEGLLAEEQASHVCLPKRILLN
ncbi:hypothetical protein RJ639_004221 [Escallonia herrerae]|uniref:Clp R domain-containing protein n=1 Tax=Escallonia herrerae TaxID=1293975 RepID=A0AA88W212_9ASTE|nr:hypothetical protein RJ639_004221 [Escallonia herrerae]